MNSLRWHIIWGTHCKINSDEFVSTMPTYNISYIIALVLREHNFWVAEIVYVPLPNECAAVVLELKKRPSPRSPSFTTPWAVMNTFAGLISKKNIAAVNFTWSYKLFYKNIDSFFFFTYVSKPEAVSWYVFTICVNNLPQDRRIIFSLPYQFTMISFVYCIPLCIIRRECICSKALQIWMKYFQMVFSGINLFWRLKC